MGKIACRRGFRNEGSLISVTLCASGPQGRVVPGNMGLVPCANSFRHTPGAKCSERAEKAFHVEVAWGVLLLFQSKEHNSGSRVEGVEFKGGSRHD